MEVVDAFRGVEMLVGLNTVDATGITTIQSAYETGIDMLAVEILIPDTYRLTTAPATVRGRIVGAPLADAPLLLGGNDLEELPEDKLVEVGHLLMLFFGHLAGLDGTCPFV